MPILLVHPNEPREVKEYLAREKLSFKEAPQLPFDYLLVYKDVRIGIERKEASDFVNSIIDGRLREQLYYLSTLCPLSYLVVVGNVTMALMERGFRREAYIGALVSSALKRSIDGESGYVSVVVLDTIYDFMLFLKVLYNQVVEEDYVRLPVLNVKKADVRGAKIAMLTAIPGIGKEYAQKLLEHFKTIYGVVNASEAELCRVLGQKRGKKVYDFLRS